MPNFKIQRGPLVVSVLLGVLFSFLFVGSMSCTREGCTDPLANNYDEKAKEDDGSCTYDNVDNVTVRFVPKINGVNLELDEIYSDDSGRDFRVTLFKFYVSDFTLSNGSNSFTDSYIHFIDLEPEPPQRENIPDWTDEFTLEADPGSYTSVSFGLGVRNDENERYTPNDYPLENPLNVTYNGMGWGWADKYKFVVMEGDFDSDSDGELDDKFFVHTGFEEMYRVLSFDKNIEIARGQNMDITFEMELSEAFKMADISELKSHSEGDNQIDISTRYTDGLVNGISIK